MGSKNKGDQFSSDEYSALLQSSDGQGVLPYSLIHNNSSMIDEKIVLEQSDAANSQKSEQNLSYFEEQSDSSTKRPLSTSERNNPILEKVQAIATFAKDLLRFNSEFDSYNQLYFQIAFDAAMTAAFVQSFRADRAALPRAVQSEIELKKIHEEITNDPLQQFFVVSIGEQALVRGNLDSKAASANSIRFLESRNSWKRQTKDQQVKNVNAEQQPLVVRSSGKQKNDMKIVFNNNVSVMAQPEFKEGVFAVKGASLFARAAGTILATSLASVHALQAKIAFMKGGSKFVDVDLYFFGKKVVHEDNAGKKATVLAVSHVFQKLNVAAKKHEQILLKGTIGIAAILGAYFAAKAVKNTAFLISKSKLYKKIKRKIDIYFL